MNVLVISAREGAPVFRPEGSTIDMRKRDLSDLKEKNILVAGGSGLIGANLTEALKGAGANVRASYFSKELFSRDADYRHFDFTKLEECINATNDMDYCIMCAAQSFGVKAMKDKPSASILPNLRINAGLLEACRINKVKRVLFISSATLYQEADYPIAEDGLDLNKPPYGLYLGVGWLNRYIEQLARFYYVRCGMEIGIVRPTSVYGPYDKFDNEYSNVIPALIKRALDKETPFVVWGDGSAVRDFMYVGDLIYDLLDVLKGCCVCDPINIGSGAQMSIKAAVDTILDVCGHKVTPQYDKTKPTAVPYRMLGLKKFESLFGKKNRTTFRDGITKTVSWYKQEFKPQFKGPSLQIK